MSRNLVLYGMMGSGKTTVAMVLAERLGRDVADTDDEVERIAGRTVAEVFAKDGEPAFRRLERLAVEHVVRRADQVVSVGGGTVLDDRNVEALRSSGVLIELRAPASVLTDRLSQAASDASDARPLLSGRDLRARVEDLLEARGDRYADTADHTVDATDSPVDVAEAVLTWAATVPGTLTRDELERVAR